MTSAAELQSGSFLRSGPEPDRAFRTVCSILVESTGRWLAGAPVRAMRDRTVRLHPTGWISIANSAEPEELHQLSTRLSTEAFDLRFSEEKILYFGFFHLRQGTTLRALEYLDGGTSATGRWSKVEGASEPWEDLLFTPEMISSCAPYAPRAELEELQRSHSIRAGLSIPWACDRDVVARIAARLELPWDALRGRALAFTKEETIAGRPASGSQKRWWKRWSR